MYQCSETSANHVITRDITCSIQQMLRQSYNLSLQSYNLNYISKIVQSRTGFLGVAGPRAHHTPCFIFMHFSRPFLKAHQMYDLKFNFDSS